MSVVASDAAVAAVAGVANDFIEEITGRPVAATEQVEQPAPQAVPEPEPTPEPSPFEADTSGLDFLDDEPDPFADDTDDDDTFETVTYEEPEEAEYVDPQVQKIIAQNKKLQAQIQHERTLRKQAKEKDWRAEAGRRFPLCQPDTLSGDSRRAILKQASIQHNRISDVVKPYIKAIDEARTGVLEEATAEGRARAEQAWGKPTSGPSTAMLEAVAVSENDANKHDRTKYRNLLESILGRQEKGFQI